MNLSPEIKAQLMEQKKQCIHCKLISGEIPNAKKVFEDSKTTALLDIYPIVKGHTIYLLKEHYPMPAYLSEEEFRHKFALIPQLAKAIKGGMVSTGINLFLAIGGAAGQQSYHLLAHLLPREEGDKFYNFMFKKGGQLNGEETKILKNNFPLMMRNHFTRNPCEWHKGEGMIPEYLKDAHENNNILYEDEKVLCVLPRGSSAKGHVIIYSKQEEKYVEKLSQEDSTHLFFTASLTSTLVFENLKAQGSNIIMKSGESDDNPLGKLEVHIFPRWQNDGLNLEWQPKQANYNLDQIAKKINDKTWAVKYEEKKAVEEKVEIVQLSAEEEIRRAIDKFSR